MKRLYKITKLLAIFMVSMIVFMFVIELYRLRVAQSDITTFMGLASNYALTSIQDVSTLKDDDGESVKTSATYYTMNGATAQSTAVPMYEKAEYGNYLSALNTAASVSGDKFLTAVHGVLKADYDRVCNELGYSTNPSHNGNVSFDGLLQYTPLSFNLPYISYRNYVAMYSEAMGVMLSDYQVFGKPAIFIGVNGDTRLTPNGGGIYASCILETTGIYSYKDSSGNETSFRLMAMDGNSIRRIYGGGTNNINAYEQAKQKLIEITKSAKYNDIRFIDSSDSVTNNFAMIPSYTVTTKTDWYYSTYSKVLNFNGEGDDDKMMGITITDDLINNLDGVSKLGTASSPYMTFMASEGSGIGQFEGGQLMFSIHKSGSSGSSGLYSVTKTYDIIN